MVDQEALGRLIVTQCKQPYWLAAKVAQWAQGQFNGPVSPVEALRQWRIAQEAGRA